MVDTQRATHDSWRLSDFNSLLGVTTQSRVQERGLLGVNARHDSMQDTQVPLLLHGVWGVGGDAVCVPGVTISCGDTNCETPVHPVWVAICSAIKNSPGKLPFSLPGGLRLAL